MVDTVRESISKTSDVWNVATSLSATLVLRSRVVRYVEANSRTKMMLLGVLLVGLYTGSEEYIGMRTGVGVG